MRTKATDTEKLIEGLRRGDRRAQLDAMHRYGRLVNSIVGAMASDPRDAEELTQDAFIKAFRSIGSFNRRRSSLSTWLGRIAYHCAVDHLRRRDSRPNPVSIEAMRPSPPPVSDGGPADPLPELLDQALELLAAEERTALQLVYFEEMSLDEAAFILSTNANALSTRLYRIRIKLARIINELKYRQ